MTNPSTSRPAIFGEVLFDSFPDGTSSLGGAAFNVAWNLKGFGLDPLFISRVGDDKNGRKVFDSMNDWGLSTEALQVDKEHQTGMVEVMLDKGEPTFSILPDQAYDFIDEDFMWSGIAGGEYSILYHGSLIARNYVSRSALELLQSQAHAPVFCDVNLRAPWWKKTHVLSMIKNVKWAKLNQEELLRLSGASFTGRESIKNIASQLCKENKIENLVLTLGADGAAIISGSGTCDIAPKPVTNIIDAVGAGDAFSSVAILGALEGWAVDIILERASSFAADICRIRGAVSHDVRLYRKHMEAWKS